MKKYNNKNEKFRHNDLFIMIQKMYDDGRKKQARRINKFAEKILSEIKFIQTFDFTEVELAFEKNISDDTIHSNFYYDLQKRVNESMVELFFERNVNLCNRKVDILEDIFMWDILDEDFNLVNNLLNEYQIEFNKLILEIYSYEWMNV